MADSSLDNDRNVMCRVYGGGGVTRYWIVDLIDGQVEVHSGPSGPSEPLGYRHCEIYQSSQDVPVVIAETEVGRVLAGRALALTRAPPKNTDKKGGHGALAGETPRPSQIKGDIAL